MYVRKDAYYRLAKKEGYPSRAAYKLKEISSRYRVLKRGDRVLDLGCAPGGWSRVALEIVGPGGRVVGVDLSAVAGIGAGNFAFIRGDVSDEEVMVKAREALQGPCDAVISDLSPHLTGVRPRDEAAAADLFAVAWSCATRSLRAGGTFLTKVFPSADLEPMMKAIRSSFRDTVLTKPGASRKGSSEVYLIGRGYRP